MQWKESHQPVSTWRWTIAMLENFLRWETTDQRKAESSRFIPAVPVGGGIQPSAHSLPGSTKPDPQTGDTWALFGKHSQIIRFTGSYGITFGAGSGIWQSLSLLPMLMSNAQCCIREVVSTTKKSVSSNLWSWHTSFSSIFSVWWESHSKLVDAFGLH